MNDKRFREEQFGTDLCYECRGDAEVTRCEASQRENKPARLR
jgi:hypothetical protein